MVENPLNGAAQLARPSLVALQESLRGRRRREWRLMSWCVSGATGGTQSRPNSDNR